MKKGFTLIELLAVIVILAIIALIVTPVVSNIVSNANNAANARSVEGHIKNIELAIISEAFATGGDMNKYDNETDGETIEGSFELPDNDTITCSSYRIVDGSIISASGCKEEDWDKIYNYSNSEGAFVFEFKGTVILPGLDSNGNPTQNIVRKADSHDTDVVLDMADAQGKSIVTYLGIVYMDPANPKTVCSVSNTNVTGTANNAACKKFYIYKDNGTSYKMIMDRNLGSTVAYNSDNVNSEMKEISIALAERTDGWIGAPSIPNADEIAKALGTQGWTGSYFYFGSRNTTQYSSQSDDEKARQRSYHWLFDYIGTCKGTHGCNVNLSGTSGYWTTTPKSNSASMLICVYASGSLGAPNNYSFYSNANDSSKYGIRPVLEVPKSLLGL